MKLKTAIFALFVMSVLTSAICLGQETRKQDINSEEKIVTEDVPDTNGLDTDSIEAENRPELSHKVIAYYFHGTRRCGSCRKIEVYSHEAIEQGFADELKKGKLEWFAINIDRGQNKHFKEDYKLHTRSLVISYIENGKQTKWKNLEKVWQLLRDEEAFLKYVQDEVRAFLEED